MLCAWVYVAALWGAGVAMAPRLQPIPLSDVLARSAAYLDDYEARFSAVISREDYQQTEKGFFLGVPQTWSRKTAAQFLILNAGSGTWLGFRDVFEADGEPVPDRLERLATLLATPATDSARAAALAKAKRSLKQIAKISDTATCATFSPASTPSSQNIQSIPIASASPAGATAVS